MSLNNLRKLANGLALINLTYKCSRQESTCFSKDEDLYDIKNIMKVSGLLNSSS
jgi:hypothetical protein